MRIRSSEITTKAPASRSALMSSEVSAQEGVLAFSAVCVTRSEQHDRRQTTVLSRKQRAEVGVARDDHSCVAVGEHEQLVVVRTFETEFERVDCVVPAFTEQLRQARRTILIDEEPHPAGCRGMTRSATASAANRSAALTSASSSGGSSSTTSAGVIPPAIMLTTVATGIRRPRRHGTPPISFGSIVIRSMPKGYSSALIPRSGVSPPDTGGQPSGPYQKAATHRTDSAPDVRRHVERSGSAASGATRRNPRCSMCLCPPGCWGYGSRVT